MMARWFSPNGTASRRDYLSIFLVWLLGTIFFDLVASDLRSSLPFDLLYLVTAVVTTVLAWLQLTATVRRLRTVHWPWWLVLPLIPISVWPVQAVFEIPVAPVATWLMAIYCFVTFDALLLHSAAPRAEVVAPRERVSRSSRSVETRTIVTSRSTEPPQVAAPVLPVALLGWLVAIDGVEMGREFRLRPSRNAADSGVIRASDGQGGPGDLAAICYVPETNSYSIAPERATVELNDRTLTQSSSLAAYDRLRIQQVSFIFVPLYGAHRRWVNPSSERKF